MKKYAFAGASSRALNSYALPMQKDYTDCTELCGVYDINPGRSNVFAQKCRGIKTYTDFDNMISTEKPDCVIVTTVDAYHSEYVIRALALGCEVICEKPLTIDADRCRAILDAEKNYGKKVTVIFNMRYGPLESKMKELISSGAVGEVYSVHFEWLLDRIMPFGAHGASYFRRWNARIAKSGGLLLHKSTHHFDFVNWLISAVPKRVAAFGKLRLYGNNNSFRGENCRKCTHTKDCPFYYELNDFEKEFYADQENYDGYYKDGCVFAEDIDIYDTMALSVEYDGGQIMSYSLNATAAYEGYRISVNGSKGRMETFNPRTGRQASGGEDTIKVFDLANNITEYHIARLSGTHGGSDAKLLENLFRGPLPDSLGRFAGTEAGANSLLIGAAANISIKEGRIVDIEALLTGK